MPQIDYARTFDAASDQIEMSVGGIAADITAMTVAALIKPVDVAAFRDILVVEDPMGFAFGLHSTDGLYMYDGATLAQSVDDLAQQSNGWMLVAVTKANGSAAPRWHRYVYSSDTWTHTTDETTLADPTTPTGSSNVYIGGQANFEGMIALVGYWRTTALSDGQLEGMVDDITAWEALTPSSLWLLDQSSTGTPVEDREGTSHQSVLTGTVATAVSDLPFGIGGGGGGGGGGTTVIETSFEAGSIGAENFASTSATPPTISTSRYWVGSRSLESSVSSVAQYGIWRFPSPPNTAAFRFYVNVFDYNQTSHDFEEFSVYNPAQSHAFTIHPQTDGGGAVTLRAAFDYGTHNLTQVSITENTWYRVEVKLDWSATGWRATWGTATGDGSLTTHDLAATGGNTFAADTLDYVLFGANTVANIIVNHDAVKFTNSGNDYPIGPVSAPAATGAGPRALLMSGVG